MSFAAVPAPAAPPEEPLYEVVNGHRVELPPMSAQSTWIASLLFGHLFPHVHGRSLGWLVSEMLFALAPESRLKRRPDVAFVSADRWPLDREPPAAGDWEVVPDLAVEVVSPNDLFQTVVAKVGEYFDHGVRQVWVVVPRERRVYVYDAPEVVRVVTADLDTPLLPGWRLPLANLFRTVLT
jgi:Uma2 family endonuclease